MNTINLKAFIEPETKSGYIRLLDEALSVADYLTEQIARLDLILEENSVARITKV